MKLNSFKQDGDEEVIESVSKLKLSDLILDSDSFLECYMKEDYKTFADKLKDIVLPTFEDIYINLRKYKKIQTITDLNDITVEYVTAKRYEIRNAINTVIGIKDRYTNNKNIWEEISYISNQMYERTKDKMLILEDIKKLKNNDLRIGEVNLRLNDLVKVIDKVNLIMIRFKQVSDEIKETLLYLQDVKDEMSRIQSSVQLALDTGEMERVYWKKND